MIAVQDDVLAERQEHNEIAIVHTDIAENTEDYLLATLQATDTMTYYQQRATAQKILHLAHAHPPQRTR